jgi:4-hydroxy-tetrahydrodipicolinate reductase
VKSNQAAAKRIDAAARRARVAVLGTGVNPGFTMDALPIALTAVCESVTAIAVDRVQDAGVRRGPFQQKIGAGLTREQFQERVDAGTVRHVGLAESITMIADAMGWKLDRVTDDIRPHVTLQRVSSQFVTVEPGLVAGIVQDGIGYVKGQPRITLHMEAYLGAPESYDAVRITGVPALSMKISGGIHGDIATASITVNSIPKVLAAPPGLRTMRDMRLPSFFGG